MDLVIPTFAKTRVSFPLKDKMLYRLFFPKLLVQWGFFEKSV